MIAGDDGQSRRNEGKVGIKFATFPGQFKGALPEKKERGIFRLTVENNTGQYRVAFMVFDFS